MSVRRLPGALAVSAGAANEAAPERSGPKAHLAEQERIAELKRAIAAGEYHVNAADLAERLMTKMRGR